MRDLPSDTKSNLPKISIGLVVYNGFDYIKGALDSIVRQSYRNIELIVVDGDSKDGTKDVLREYAEHISVLVSEPDKGIYDAMNKVCSLATGDWLIFIGCDDLLLDTLGNMAKLMTDPDAVYYGDVIFRSSGKIYGGKFSKFRIMKENICHQALFYPRSVYSKHAYSLAYRLQADYAYNWMLLGLGIKFVYTGVVVSLFNNGGTSFSKPDEDFVRDRLEAIASSLGPVYALVEIVFTIIKYPIKHLIPTSVWKYLQSLYRKNY